MTHKRKPNAARFVPSLLAVWMVGAVVFGQPAKTTASEPSRSFVLRAGKIHPVSRLMPVEIENGVIVVRDGRIVTVGQDIELPPDLPVIDLPDAVVMPGLVSAAGQLTEQHGGEEALSGLYMAADAFLSYRDYKRELAAGVSTAHLSPGEHRLISGHGAVVSLGGPVKDRMLSASSDITLNIDENGYRPPNIVRYQSPVSSDNALPDPIRQRPFSRLGVFLALDEWIENNVNRRGKADALLHDRLLAASWHRGTTLRIHVDRREDLENTLGFLSRHDRSEAYLVGAAEMGGLEGRILDAGIPVVYRVRQTLGTVGDDLGFDPDLVRQDMDILGKLSTRVPLALAVAEGRPVSHLRLTAALALRSGMPRKRSRLAISRCRSVFIMAAPSRCAPPRGSGTTSSIS